MPDTEAAGLGDCAFSGLIVEARHRCTEIERHGRSSLDRRAQGHQVFLESDSSNRARSVVGLAFSYPRLLFHSIATLVIARTSLLS